MSSEKETKQELEQTLGTTTRDPLKVKKSPLPAQRPGSLLLARAIRSLGSTDGVENRERCGARDARDLRGLPRAGGAQGTQRLLGQRPAEDDDHGQAQLSTAGYSPLPPPARTDPTFPTPSTLSTTRSRRESTQGLQTAAHPGHSSPGHHAPAAGDCPAAHNPQVQAARGTRAPPERTLRAEPSNLRSGARGSPPGSRGWGGTDYQPPHSPVPRGPLGRCRHKGDARVTHLVPRGPGSRSASLRAAAMAPAGAGSRVPLAPSASRAQPAPQRSALYASPPCAPRTARGVGGARARTKRGRGRQSQFARQRPLPSRGAATSMHRRVAPSKATPEGPCQLTDGGALEESKDAKRPREGGPLLQCYINKYQQLERNA